MRKKRKPNAGYERIVMKEVTYHTPRLSHDLSRRTDVTSNFGGLTAQRTNAAQQFWASQPF